MSLLKSEKKELAILKRIVKGTPIKVTLYDDIGHIKVSGGGFEDSIRQITSNVGVSPREMVKARVKIWKKRNKRN